MRHAIAQLVAREAQQRGGLHLVAMTAFQRLLHQAAFDGSQEGGQLEARGGQMDLLL